VFAALIFLAAGTWSYWQGWLFLAVFTTLTAGSTVYLARNDPALLERRLAGGPWKEKERSQQVIVSAIMLTFFAAIVWPALDYRFGLAPVPAAVSLWGEALTVGSFLATFRVVAANSWAAANVSVAADQRVVDTGPYAYVRHPMYACAVWLFAGIPLALGSWAPVAIVMLVLPVLIWRLTDEERVLQRDLPGYADYMRRVPYRLVPHIW
jgi:protein-S-isoprenylcysteine O-methyltransferase Ste14